MSIATASPNEPARRGESEPRARRRTLIALSLAVLMPSLDTSIANVALPTMARAFGATFQGVQWIVLAYLLAVTTLIVSAGSLGDRLGRRRLLLTGIAVFTVASLLCGVATSLSLLVAARALQGLGAALMLSLAVAFAGEAVPDARRGSAMGLLGTMSAIGTTLGPALGGLLLGHAGWPVIFLVNVPIGIATFVLAKGVLPAADARRNQDARRFDVRGTVLLAATLAAYALAMTVGHGALGRANAALLSLAVVGALLFARAMANGASPLVRLAMLREGKAGQGLAAIALVSTVMMATLVVGPFYLSRSLGLAPSRVGLVMSVGPLVAAIAGIPAGRLVDRVGAAHMTTAGLVLLATGLVALALVPAYTGTAGYLVSMSVVTASYALFQTATITAITAGAASEQRGVVAGLLGLSRNVGLITGASAMGAIFSAASSSADVASAPPSAVAAGMRITFLVASGIAVLALAVTRIGRDGTRAPAVPARPPDRCPSC